MIDMFHNLSEKPAHSLFNEDCQRRRPNGTFTEEKQRTSGFSAWEYAWAVGVCFLYLFALPAVSDSEDRPQTICPKVFRFGVLGLLNGVNKKDAQMIIELNLVRNNRKEFPDMKVHLEIIPDVSSAAKLFDQQRLHSIVLTSSDYLALKEQTSVVTPLLLSSSKANPLEAYILLVSNRVTSIDHLSSLTSRRLVMENAGETTIGQMWLDTVLWEHGQHDSRSFFSTIRKESKTARMVLPVFFDQAEACLVPESAFETMNELNPQIGSRLKVLKRSPEFAGLVTCAIENLAPRLIAAITHNATTLHNSVAGRQLQMIFHSRSHHLFAPDYLEATEHVYGIYKKQATKQLGTEAIP
jgi:ABC-type phosphate/phosphonate transport system substrate-binding protein